MQQANSKKREKADSEDAWRGARTKAQPPRSGRRFLPETERKRPNALAALQRDNRKRKKKLLDFYQEMTAVIGKWVETNLFFYFKIMI